jgi:predicted small secreted protein
MKRILIAAVCAATLLLSGCENSTQFGSCVGIGETQNPKLTYKISALNLVMSVLFFELIAPPVIVATDEFYCPNGIKQ